MVSPYDPNKIIQQEQDSETSLAVSLAAGVGSGLVKIPLGLASVAAEIYDAARGEGLEPDASAVAALEKFIDTTVVCQVVQGLESKRYSCWKNYRSLSAVRISCCQRSKDRFRYC